jgi:HAD superfamily hydrolase (TIGR01509 family)
MRLTDFEALIFDLDGTLIDSGKYHARAFADAVLIQSGYTLTPGEHDEFFASHSIPFAQVLNRRHELSLEPERVLDEKRRRMAEIFVTELFEGVREILERWHGVKPLALATNSPAAFTMPALKQAEIQDLFSCIITSDEVENRKPDPEIFEMTVQKLGVDPLNTLAFEDQLIGIEAARMAGIQVMAIDNGQQVEFPPDVHVSTWKQLLSE